MVAVIVVAVIVVAVIVVAVIVVSLMRCIGLADGRTRRLLTAQRGNQKRKKQSEQRELYEMAHTEPLHVGKLRKKHVHRLRRYLKCK